MAKKNERVSLALRTCTAVLLITAATACNSTPNGQREMAAAGDDQTSPPRTVVGVMGRKMAHTYAIMEGISLADYRQVEVNGSNSTTSVFNPTGWFIAR